MNVNNSTETVESQPNDQPAENVEAEVLEERVDSTEETDVKEAEQPKEDSVEESFMGKGFDPKSLKDPELQKAYKQMQSKWTKDNQEVSKIKKEYEQLQGWRKDLESNPQFIQWANDMERLAKLQQQGSPDLDSMTEEERVNFLVEQKINDYVNTNVNPRVQTLEQERATAKVDKFLTDNPKAKEYAQQISAEMKNTPGVSMEKAWKYVQAELGISKEDAKKEVLSDLEVKSDANLERPGPHASQPARKKGMTVEESAELAERQTGHNF